MNILLARKYREYLQFPRVDGIINLYHQYRKDGKYACYGKVPNSRGGVSRTEDIHRYRSQDTQPQEPQEEANRFKDWRNVADLAGGLGSVRGVSKEHRQIRINSFILWVAHSPPITYQGAKQRVVSVLLAAYFTTLRNALQQETTQSNALHG